MSAAIRADHDSLPARCTAGARIPHEQLAQLPALHKDPLDRMLVAQANAEPMRLSTPDAVLASYGANVELI